MCARTPGHGGSCITAENMARRRKYRRNHPHPESPESRKKSNRKYRISSYGLTQEQFDRLLDTQQYACGICNEPFEDGSLSTWTMTMRAAKRKAGHAAGACADCFATPATSR